MLQDFDIGIATAPNLSPYCFAKTYSCLLCYQALVKHKYGAILNCKISIKFSGAEDLRLLSCTFKLAGEHTNMGLMTAGEIPAKHSHALISAIRA